mmetsp:Transcript_3618/g.11330  ORF Transcript_3618/g.11330 Transcript_3618/m.11330 type:complete len:325 (-) Transcript_3618:353-1327(-)
MTMRSWTKSWSPASGGSSGRAATRSRRAASTASVSSSLSLSSDLPVSAGAASRWIASRSGMGADNMLCTCSSSAATTRCAARGTVHLRPSSSMRACTRTLSRTSLSVWATLCCSSRLASSTRRSRSTRASVARDLRSSRRFSRSWRRRSRCAFELAAAYLSFSPFFVFCGLAAGDAASLCAAVGVASSSWSECASCSPCWSERISIAGPSERAAIMVSSSKAPMAAVLSSRSTPRATTTDSDASGSSSAAASPFVFWGALSRFLAASASAAAALAAAARLRSRSSASRFAARSADMPRRATSRQHGGSAPLMFILTSSPSSPLT